MSDEDVASQLDKAVKGDGMKVHWGVVVVVALIAFAVATYWNPVAMLRAKAGV